MTARPYTGERLSGVAFSVKSKIKSICFPLVWLTKSACSDRATLCRKLLDPPVHLQPWIVERHLCTMRGRILDLFLQIVVDQHHAYTLASPEVTGSTVSEIPFSHPDQIAKILICLRRQAAMNQLALSCMRPLQENGKLLPNIFRRLIANLFQSWKPYSSFASLFHRIGWCLWHSWILWTLLHAAVSWFIAEIPHLALINVLFLVEISTADPVSPSCKFVETALPLCSEGLMNLWIAKLVTTTNQLESSERLARLPISFVCGIASSSGCTKDLHNPQL